MQRSFKFSEFTKIPKKHEIFLKFFQIPENSSNLKKSEFLQVHEHSLTFFIFLKKIEFLEFLKFPLISLKFLGILWISLNKFP
jgi:hypothetical protein